MVDCDQDVLKTVAMSTPALTALSVSLSVSVCLCLSLDMSICHQL